MSRFKGEKILSCSCVCHDLINPDRIPCDVCWDGHEYRTDEDREI